MTSLMLVLAALASAGAARAEPAPPSSQPKFLERRGVEYSTSPAAPEWFVDVSSPAAKALKDDLPTYAVGFMTELPGAAWQDQLFGCVIQAMAGVQEQAESFVPTVRKDYRADGTRGSADVVSSSVNNFSQVTWGQPPFKLRAFKKRYSSTVGRADEIFASTTVMLLLTDDLLGMPKIGFSRSAVFEGWLASGSSESGWYPPEGPRLDSPRLSRALDAFQKAGFVLAKTHANAGGMRCAVSMSAEDFRAAVKREKGPATP